jgi:hypothetical protein
MNFLRKHSKIAVVAVSCAALGAGAGAVASAGAANGSSPGPRAAHGFRARALMRVARRAVEGQLVVPTKTGFATVSFQRGVVDSVSGQQLTLTEGTRTASYKTVTVTIPAGARVRDDRQVASLGSLTRGQRVLVVHAPKRTFVIAHTPKVG